LTWNQVGYRAKPCCLPGHRRMVLTSPDPGELIDLFAKYDPPQVGKRIEMKKGL
jgi:hypothetical protein